MTSSGPRQPLKLPVEKARSERLKDRNEGLLGRCSKFRLGVWLTVGRPQTHPHPEAQGRTAARSLSPSNPLADSLRDALNDKGYHKIYEALFRIASAEKSAYGKATKVNVKTQAAARLSSCASVIRLAVEAGAAKLKQRTVKALLDHLTQTLPLPGGTFCEPLALDYTKSLRVLLDFQPHVEHLSDSDWDALVAFCCEGIQKHQGPAIESDSSSSNGLSVRLASTGTSSRGSGTAGPSDSSHEPGSHFRATAEELILTLEQLLLVGKMPNIGLAQDLFTTIVRFLQLTTTVGRVHHSAFSAFNGCLSRTRTDHIPLTKEALAQVLPLIRRFWPTKSSALKDEMLTTLIHGQCYLKSMALSDDNLEIRAELERLLDTLEADYRKRLEREQLQLDDLGLAISRPLPSQHHPLRLRVMYLRASSTRAEQSWLMLEMMSSLILMLDSRPGPPSKPEAPKKRRIDTRFSALLRQLKIADSAVMFCSLQLIPFLLEWRVLAEEELASLVEPISSLLSDGDGLTASWAMVALSRSVK